MRRGWRRPRVTSAGGGKAPRAPPPQRRQGAPPPPPAVTRALPLLTPPPPTPAPRSSRRHGDRWVRSGPYEADAVGGPARAGAAPARAEAVLENRGAAGPPGWRWRRRRPWACGGGEVRGGRRRPPRPEAAGAAPEGTWQRPPPLRTGGAFPAAGGQVPAGREGRRPVRGPGGPRSGRWGGPGSAPGRCPQPRRCFVLSRPAREAADRCGRGMAELCPGGSVRLRCCGAARVAVSCRSRLCPFQPQGPIARWPAPYRKRWVGSPPPLPGQVRGSASG